MPARDPGRAAPVVERYREQGAAALLHSEVQILAIAGGVKPQPKGGAQVELRGARVVRTGRVHSSSAGRYSVREIAGVAVPFEPEPKGNAEVRQGGREIRHPFRQEAHGPPASLNRVVEVGAPTPALHAEDGCQREVGQHGATDGVSASLAPAPHGTGARRRLVRQSPVGA